MKGVAFYAGDPWALGAGRGGILVGRVLFPSLAPFPFAILPSIVWVMGCLIDHRGGHGKGRLIGNGKLLLVPSGRRRTYEGPTLEFAYLLSLSLSLGPLLSIVPSHGCTEGRDLGR